MSKATSIYVVVEKTCATEHDEDYQLVSCIKEGHKDLSVAENAKIRCEKDAEDDGQDYKYEIKEVPVFL